MTGRSLRAEVVMCPRSGVWELNSHPLSLPSSSFEHVMCWVYICEEMEGALAHQREMLLVPVCMKQVCNQQEKAAKMLQEPSYFKGSL